jgi:integrase
MSRIRRRVRGSIAESRGRYASSTPAFVEGEVQTLLSAVAASTHTGLRDRALLGVLAYTFARIGAVVHLKLEDYYPSGKRFLVRFKEKSGKEKELPVHHKVGRVPRRIPQSDRARRRARFALVPGCLEKD